MCLAQHAPRPRCPPMVPDLSRSFPTLSRHVQTRDEKTDLFFFDLRGGQPERLDTPRREGVICLAASPLRPLIVFLCPTGEMYFREQV